MVKILPPDYSILDKLDIWKDYSRDEIIDLYNRVHHYDDPEQVKAVHESRKNAPFGSPFVLRKVGKITPDMMCEIKVSASNRAIDKDHERAIILEYTGKITKNEFSQQLFISWFKKEIAKLRRIMSK